MPENYCSATDFACAANFSAHCDSLHNSSACVRYLRRYHLQQTTPSKVVAVCNCITHTRYSTGLLLRLRPLASNNELSAVKAHYIERWSCMSERWVAEVAESDVGRRVVVSTVYRRFVPRTRLRRRSRAGRQRRRLRPSDIRCHERVTSYTRPAFQRLTASRQVAQPSPRNFCTSTANCFTFQGQWRPGTGGPDP